MYGANKHSLSNRVMRLPHLIKIPFDLHPNVLKSEINCSLFTHRQAIDEKFVPYNSLWLSTTVLLHYTMSI